MVIVMLLAEVFAAGVSGAFGQTWAILSTSRRRFHVPAVSSMRLN